jgi:ABC-type transport system substrate-binding protein
MKRRTLLSATAAGIALNSGVRSATAASSDARVLRYAFRIAETTFDPAQVTDMYSRIVIGHILEGLYTYDHLASPPLLKPLTAAALPEHSEDFKTWTVRLRPGIFFADDPAFKGARPGEGRELVAEDYVYSFKRIADPKVNSSSWGELEEVGLLGLKEYRDALRASKADFDYDRPIEGLRALDRYTLQFRLREARPRFIYTFAQTELYGAVAREVIEAYPGRSGDHPVGTGPFVLKDWRRSSLIVLERNPKYRERLYEQEVHPAPDDAEGQALLKRFKGRRLPMVDRVEVSIIEEDQPRWLAFLNGEQNFLERLAPTYISQALLHDRVAPGLARRGIQAYRALTSDVLFTVFNMNDPVVGGYTPEKVALRRAIGLATDIFAEIKTLRRGQAIPAQSMFLPYTYGYDPQVKTEMSDFDPARAKALLDLYGYLDRDGDGWRELPDGSPLVLESLTTPDLTQRQIDTLWQKNMAAVGLKVDFKTGQWPDNYKALRVGAFQIWSLASSGALPDGQDAMANLYTPMIGSYNHAHFSLPAYDELYKRCSEMPDGPERLALMAEVRRLTVAYMPCKYRGHRFITDMAHKEVIGYRRPPLWVNWWEYVDVEARKA